MKSSFKAIRSISLLGVSQIINVVAAFVTQLILTRILNVVDYGTLATSLTIIMFFSQVAGFGIGPFWLQQFGRDGWKGFRWISSSLRFIAFSILIASFGALMYAGLIEKNIAVRQTLPWLLSVLVAQGILSPALAAFQLEGKYKKFAFWQIFVNVGRSLFVMAIAILGSGLSIVVIGYCLISFLQILILGSTIFVQILKKEINLIGHGAKPVTRIEKRPKKIIDVLHGSWPFALGSIFFLIYSQIGIVFLSWIEGSGSAGLFNAALVVLSTIYLLPNTIYQQYLLPHFFRWAEHDKTKLIRLYRLGNGTMIFMGIVIGALMALLSTWFAPIVFGLEYSSVGYLLRLMAICIPVRFLASSVSAVLTTGGLIRLKAFYQAIAVIVNILGNISLIPYMGIYGAGIATIMSELVLLSLFLYAVRKHVFGQEAMRGWNINWLGNGNLE